MIKKRTAKTILVAVAPLAREARLSLALILLAGVMAGAGAYLRSGPDWLKRADVRDYNRGVTAYEVPSTRSTQPLEQAIALFEQTVMGSKDTTLKALALYNLATIGGTDALKTIQQVQQMYAAQGGKGMEEDQSLLLARRAVREAMAKLTEAIRLDPTNEDAKLNLELLEREMGGKEISGSQYAGGEVDKGY